MGNEAPICPTCGDRLHFYADTCALDTLTGKLVCTKCERNTELRALTAERDQLRAELAQLRQDYLDVADAIAPSSTGSADLVAAVRSLRAELALCKTDRDREERCHIKQAEDNVALRAELAENEGVIRVWRGRTERAEAELAEAKAARAESTASRVEWQKRAVMAESELRSLQSELAAVKGQLSDAHDSIDTWAEENGEIQQQLAAARAEASRWELVAKTDHHEDCRKRDQGMAAAVVSLRALVGELLTALGRARDAMHEVHGMQISGVIDELSDEWVEREIAVLDAAIARAKGVLS